jgi:DNA-binding transcriptional MerR regulator
MAKDTDKQCPQASADARDSAGHGAKSAAVRERAILALVSEKSIGAAAKRCGVNEKTLRRWMTEETFKRELAEARRSLFEAGMARVQALTGDAIETLAKLLRGKTPAHVKLGAARTIAEIAINRDDAETILRKLYELEAHQRQRETWRR